MRFNERQMILVSHQKADFEDRLNYKKVTIVLSNSQNKGYKELWFKLIYNLLFYFKFNEFGQIDLSQKMAFVPVKKTKPTVGLDVILRLRIGTSMGSEPTGMIVLENSLVQYEEDSETPFAFSIMFQGDPKKHLFAARSEGTVRKWMVALKKASCEQLKKEVQLLEEAISQKKKKLEKRLNFGLTLHPGGSETVGNGGTQNAIDALINF